MKLPKSTVDLGLADAAELHAVCIGAGLSHREALLRLGRRLSAGSMPELQSAIEEIQNGKSVADAFEELASSDANPRLRDFALSISLSLKLGTPLEPPLLRLAGHIRDSWLAEFKVAALASETRMLLPQVALSLPLTIIFALYPTLKMLGGWAF